MDTSAAPMLDLSRELICPGDRICAAISGGADSVAMLLFLVAANGMPRDSLGVALSAVHVNHNLRGLAAEADALFVLELCDRLQVRLHLRSVDVPARVAETGETVEEAARNLRYGIFRELIANDEADSILTAHTLDDQAETVMMKLLRGAWTEGLSGIHPVIPVSSITGRGGRILRPMLTIRRKQVEGYLRGQDQPWREDASNADTAFTRNRLRHELMPVLRTYNPGVDKALANLAELAREEEARWSAEMARTLPQLLLPGKPVRGGGRSVGTVPGEDGVAIEIDRLRSMDGAFCRRVLRAAAIRLGARLNFEETTKLMALCGRGTHPLVTTRAGAVLQLSHQLRAERSIREIRLSRAAERP